MKIVKNIKACAVCGKEDDYMELMSNLVMGTPDLDLKPNGSMASLGDEIQMCQHCGYCNYDISAQFNPDYTTNLHGWTNNQPVQKIIKRRVNEAVKKYSIMACQYADYDDYENAYIMAIKASWSADNKRLAKELMNDACDIYNEFIAPKRANELFQLVDILRQCKRFDEAIKMLEISKTMINERHDNYDTLKKIADFETILINKKDSSRHNMSELS